ncbi:hypothetical protein AVEN_201138-1 [Araneus ventricosus]|uniref:Uncharacterized protein n=1 Tax=Araneus ventricosus TaxID=182803 RepID=A0A4Y2ILG4_ARAVE|nr:hypothetical protein AVEN_201138-1 [Araneus ventricosus]
MHEHYKKTTENLFVFEVRLVTHRSSILLLLSNPSDLNQIRSMRSFAFINSSTKSGRLNRSSYSKATQELASPVVVLSVANSKKTKSEWSRYDLGCGTT